MEDFIFCVCFRESSTSKCQLIEIIQVNERQSARREMGFKGFVRVVENIENSWSLIISLSGGREMSLCGSRNVMKGRLLYKVISSKRKFSG